MPRTPASVDPRVFEETRKERPFPTPEREKEIRDLHERYRTSVYYKEGFDAIEDLLRLLGRERRNVLRLKRVARTLREDYSHERNREWRGNEG